jgi:hypothetical protein
MISHSGSTAELVSILPLLRQRARFLIAVTASKESPLAQSSNGWLDARSASLPSNTSMDPDLGTMTRLAEADPHVPAPTSSVVVALGVLDAMSLALMRVRVGMWGTLRRGGEEDVVWDEPSRWGVGEETRGRRWDRQGLSESPFVALHWRQ